MLRGLFTSWRGALIALCVTLIAVVACAPAVAGSRSLAAVRFDGAAAGDRAGTSVASAGDVNGDGHADLIIGAPGALGRASFSGGIAYVAFGPFTPGQVVDLGKLGTRGFAIRGAHATIQDEVGKGQLLGQSVAGAGDVNGDGLADVIVGAPGASVDQEGPMTQPGRAYVVFGGRNPHDVDVRRLGSAGLTLTGTTQYFPDTFGWRVASAGDVNGDKLADVLIAAPGNPGYEDEGTAARAYVVFGRKSGGAVAMAHLGRGGFRIVNGTAGLGSEVTPVGDWNRDGGADVAVIALGGRPAYAVDVIYGKRDARTVDVARLGRGGLTIAVGREFEIQDGVIAGGVDVTGDHRPDLVLGLPFMHRSNGGVWVVAGTRSRTRIDLTRPNGRGREVARGGHDWLAGYSLALGGVNAARPGDVVLLGFGSPVVLYGSHTQRTTRLDALAPARGFVVDAGVQPTNTDWTIPGFGGFTSVAAGDLTGDGRSDILAGARFTGAPARDRAGAAYVFVAP